MIDYMTTLTELKARANELGLTPDDVRQYGMLSKKATWLLAIDNHVSETKPTEPTKVKETEITNESPVTETLPETTTEQATTDATEVNPISDSDNVADRLIDILEELTELEKVTGDNPFKDNDKWLEDTTQTDLEGNTTYLYETKDYAVVDNTIYAGFDCNGYTFILKPNTIVYDSKTTRPLWIAQLDDAKKTCDKLQAKFDSDVKIAVDNIPSVGYFLDDDTDDICILIDGEKVLASEVVLTANLLTLQKTDDRFKYYQNWMMPGAKFTTGHQIYEILYFDTYGNCHAKGTDQSWHSFHLETIFKCRLFNWSEVSNNVHVKPTLSMLYKPTVVTRNTRLKSEGSTGQFRQLNVLYDRQFIVWKLANVLSEFGRDDEHLLKGLFDDVLTQVKVNEHNSDVFKGAMGIDPNFDNE